jgi:hypothetical protein
MNTKFCVKICIGANETLALLTFAYADYTMKELSASESHRRFIQGWEDVQDDPRGGQWKNSEDGCKSGQCTYIVKNSSLVQKEQKTIGESDVHVCVVKGGWAAISITSLLIGTTFPFSRNKTKIQWAYRATKAHACLYTLRAVCVTKCRHWGHKSIHASLLSRFRLLEYTVAGQQSRQSTACDHIRLRNAIQRKTSQQDDGKLSRAAPQQETYLAQTHIRKMEANGNDAHQNVLVTWMQVNTQTNLDLWNTTVG